MPGEPPDPGIVQSFLDQLTAGSWSPYNGVINADTGGLTFPHVAPSTLWPAVGQWGFSGTGFKLSEAIYNVLRDGTANSNGSFTDAAGATHYVGIREGWIAMVAA